MERDGYRPRCFAHTGGRIWERNDGLKKEGGDEEQNSKKKFFFFAI